MHVDQSTRTQLVHTFLELHTSNAKQQFKGCAVLSLRLTNCGVLTDNYDRL